MLDVKRRADLVRRIARRTGTAAAKTSGWSDVPAKAAADPRLLDLLKQAGRLENTNPVGQ